MKRPCNASRTSPSGKHRSNGAVLPSNKSLTVHSTSRWCPNSPHRRCGSSRLCQRGCCSLHRCAHIRETDVQLPRPCTTLVAPHIPSLSRHGKDRAVPRLYCGCSHNRLRPGRQCMCSRDHRNPTCARGLTAGALPPLPKPKVSRSGGGPCKPAERVRQRSGRRDS